LPKIYKARLFLGILAANTMIFAALIFMAGCWRAAPDPATPLQHRGYIWQREWNGALADSLATARKKMNGVVILGTEIVWKGKEPETISASINWEMLKENEVPCSIALRIAPVPASIFQDKTIADFVFTTVQALVAQVHSHGLTLQEFQLDFDCAQKDLRGYGALVRTLRPLLRPVRLVITTLPSWLDEAEFAALVGVADGYVLQVHSVPTFHETGRASLCDVQLARKWVAKAASFGLPFSVALPTYRCTAGYNRSGKLLSVAMDSVQPAWPPDTRILEFETSPDEIADLVKEWQQRRPPELREIIWYRLPAASDTRNWRWITLLKVMSGERPLHKLDVLQEGENPVDVSVVNSGEADERLSAVVTVNWSGQPLIAADALSGWSVNSGKEEAVFTTAPEFRIRLSPGGKREIGWLRFEQPTSLHLQLARKNEADR
jgi:Protein of unknown function (DUF3142)